VKIRTVKESDLEINCACRHPSNRKYRNSVPPPAYSKTEKRRLVNAPDTKPIEATDSIRSHYRQGEGDPILDLLLFMCILTARSHASRNPRYLAGIETLAIVARARFGATMARSLQSLPDHLVLARQRATRRDDNKRQSASPTFFRMLFLGRQFPRRSRETLDNVFI